MSQDHDNIPVLDLAQLEQIQQLEQFKPGLRVQLLTLFEQSSAEHLRTFSAALAEDDHATAKRAAHSIKGVAASMGAMRLSMLAARLEAAIGRDEASGLREGAAALSEEIATALSQLRADPLR